MKIRWTSAAFFTMAATSNIIFLKTTAVRKLALDPATLSLGVRVGRGFNYSS